MSETPAKDTFRDEAGHLLPGHPPLPGGGRPKGSGLSLVSMLRAKMKEIPLGQVKSYAEQLIENMLEAAIVQKDSNTIKTILQYLEGMPRQNIGLDGGTDGSPVIVAVETQEMAKRAIEAFLNAESGESEDATAVSPAAADPNATRIS